MNPTLEFLRELHAIREAKNGDFQRLRLSNEIAEQSIWQRYNKILNQLAEKYGVPVELIQ